MTLSSKTKQLSYPTIFSQDQLAKLDFNKIPGHVAIMMDGNRRWAKQNNLPIELGHAKGSGRLKEIVQAAVELKINTLTVYSLSTENKNRSKEEIEGLLSLFKQYLISERDDMIKNGICLHAIGDLSFFPQDIQEALKETQRVTQKGHQLNLVIAMNYGARDEIKRAVQKITQDCLDKKIEASNISEELISKYLDTAKFSDPNLLIRTSGEFRLSNFLLWQISYTELYILRKFWPEFEPIDLLNAVKSYQEREIRRGI